MLYGEIIDVFFWRPYRTRKYNLYEESRIVAVQVLSLGLKHGVNAMPLVV